MKKLLNMSLGVGMAGLFCLSGGACAQQAAFTNAPVDVFAGPRRIIQLCRSCRRDFR